MIRALSGTFGRSWGRRFRRHSRSTGPDVDLDFGTVVFASTVVRTKERGREVQEHGKSNASNRAISVPIEALELLERRDRATEYVFPSVAGKLRDVGTEADWRANRVRLGYPTVTSHGLRRTCATALEGAASRRAASLTTSVTSGRR